MKRYEQKFKEKIIKLHLSEGHSRKTLENEYNLNNETTAKWITYSKECQTDIAKQNQQQYYAEYLKI